MADIHAAIPQKTPQPAAALQQKLDALIGRVSDPFSLQALEGAQRALMDAENPLRLNFFSTAMRILFEHIMDTLSPIDEVTRCPWFEAERENGLPTRWQRVVFAIQGGFSDDFVKNILKVDPQRLRQRLLQTVDGLSKHVHGRKDTIIRDQAEQDAVADVTLEAMAAFFDTLHECRAAILDPVAEALDEAAVDALLSETLGEVDELASHYSLEEVYVDRVVVHAIGPELVTFRATGSIAVTLQWGSNSDLRRGDGAELGQSFPFYCDFSTFLDEPWELGAVEPTFGVDTRKWTDSMWPDEFDDEPL